MVGVLVQMNVKWRLSTRPEIMKKIPRWTERITKILMTEVRAKTVTVRAAENGADRAVALEVETAVRALLAQGREKERSRGPGRALLHHVVHEDHVAGIAVQDHEAEEVLDEAMGVVVAETETVAEIGALMTTMRMRVTGSMSPTWIVTLLNGTWKSFSASMGH